MACKIKKKYEKFYTRKKIVIIQKEKKNEKSLRAPQVSREMQFTTWSSKILTCQGQGKNL